MFVVAAGVEDVEDFPIRRDRPVELFFLLEIGGFLSQRSDVGHESA